MSAQEDYERLERALLELEQGGLMRTSWQSRKLWDPREAQRQRTAFRKAIQEFWQSTMRISGIDEKTTMREFFWERDDPTDRHAVVVRLDRRLWSLGFIGGQTLLEKVYPKGTQMSGRKDWDPRQEWDQVDFDMFTSSYIETALWSSSDESEEPLDKNYSAKDIDPNTIKRMGNDAFEFLRQNWELVKMNLIEAGHDFWLTRNGHGAGFWDGDWPKEAGEILTKNAHAFGGYNLFVGDDNEIYGAPG